MDVHSSVPDDATEIEGVETLRLTSVGIDIGSSTSHLTFSQLTARRLGTGYSSNYQISDKELVYRSDIRLTPYVEGNTIDVDELHAFIDHAYEQAGITMDEVDTGAVIVTGEAAKKKNAERIANIFSERAGKFVTASAGPTLEAIMAAHGAGAVEVSEETDSTVMNIDMGGGTSKITTIDRGEIVDTASINVGARLVATDSDGTIERAEPTVRTVAELAGLDLDLTVDERLDDEGKETLANTLAETLFDFLSSPDASDHSALTRELTIADPGFALTDVDILTFSGGCSEYVYGAESRDFGDLGVRLGQAVRSRAEAANGEIRRIGGGIRATVIGSTQYSVQISGNTIHVTDEELLPIRNYQVLPVEMQIDDPVDAIYPRVEAKIDEYDLDEFDQEFALCFNVTGTVPEYSTMKAIADVATTVWEEYDRSGPVLTVLDADLAQSVGKLIEKQVGPDRGVVTIDGVDVGTLEYVDVGESLQESGAVPVIVKSLVFGARPE